MKSYELLWQISAKSYELPWQISAKSYELLLTRSVRFLRADPPPRPPRQVSIGRELQAKIEERACNRATLFKPQVDLLYKPPLPSPR